MNMSSFLKSPAPCSPNAYLHLCIGPARDLHHHVKDCALRVGKERDVVEWRDVLVTLLCKASAESIAIERSQGGRGQL